MKKAIIIFFAVLLIVPAFGQKWKGFSKLAKSAWNTLDKVLTVREVYNWVNEDRSPTVRFINPSGTWRSTSGNTFTIALNNYGMIYQNNYSRDVVYTQSTGVTNFYFANLPDGIYYYTVIDANNIVVNTSQGREFRWRRN